MMKPFTVPSLLLVFLAVRTAAGGHDDSKPEPKLPLGKETTYVTRPLDRNGYIDYEAALNERLGRGITGMRLGGNVAELSVA